MSLKASINTDVQGNIRIKMNGGLDYENALPLRDELTSLISDFPEATIILDLNRVDFVGSSGIKVFVETIKLFNKTKPRIKLTNVGQEFIKVFRLYTIDEAIILMDEFDQNFTDLFKSACGRTFQN